jgi:hypothetical protein
MIGVFFALAALCCFTARTTSLRLMAALVLVLLGAGMAQFLTVAITSGTMDTAKHMFLFRAIVDLIAILGLFSAVACLATVVAGGEKRGGPSRESADGGDAGRTSLMARSGRATSSLGRSGN